MKTVKRVISVILALLLLPWTVLCSTAISNPFSVPFDILDPQLWEGSDAVQQIRSRPSGEGSMLYVSAAGTGETTLSISADLEQPLELASLRELAFSMYISGSGECSFTVTFLCGGIYYNASTKVSAGGKTMAYMLLPQQVKGSVDALALTLTRQDEPIQSFSILSASGDERYSYAHVERFMSAGFESVTGSLREEENRIFINAENGGASFFPQYISKETEDVGAAVCLRIRSGQASGTIAVEGVSGTAPLPLAAGEHTYVFVIEGAYSDLKYVLNGVTATQEDPLVITSAAVYPSKAFAAEKVGTITSCRSDGKSVTVKGTLSSETVVEHIDGQLALYMIPVWEEEEAILQKEPAAKMSISTRFELSAVPENLEVLYKYKVMILSGDKKISVAPAAFLNSGVAVTVADASVTGVHGTDTVGVFESNVSNVILDVYADRLLETDDVYAALLYNAGRSHYYFDRSYVEELDAQISVYKSSGTHVYIRLFSSQENGFVYTASDQGSVLQMYALTSFLAERYQGTAGFIMGSGVNLQYWDDPESLASLTAIFAEIVQKKCPGAAAVVPVGSVYDANTVYSPAGLSPKDPALFLSLLSFTLSRRRAGSILLAFETFSHPEGAVLEASYLASLIAACGHACDGGMLFWQPNVGSDADISAQYESLCLEAMQSGLRSAVLSVANLHVSDLLFDRIKETVFDNTSAQLLQRMAAVNNTAAYLGTYPLWDFTDSYDIGGWVSGGGMGRVVSADAENAPGRVLRTKLENASGEAGLLLCWLDRPLNLSEGSVVFSFALHNIGQEGELSVIFGSGDSRAEYLFSQPQDTYFTVTCDLMDFSAASAVEYIAIILRGESGAALEISNVKVCSMVKTEQQLQQFIEGVQEKTQPANPAYYVLLVSMAAITVAIFSMLGRRSGRKAHKNMQQKG